MGNIGFIGLGIMGRPMAAHLLLPGTSFSHSAADLCRRGLFKLEQSPVQAAVKWRIVPIL